jgi:hypothetical protein
MELCQSSHEFAERAARGDSAYALPAIEVAHEYYDRLEDRLFEQGLGTHQVVGLISRDYRSLCPLCGCWTDADVLGMLSTVRHEWEQGATTTLLGGGSITRLLDGRCPNHRCKGDRIVLIWGGCTPVRTHLLHHLARARGASGAIAQQGMANHLEELARPEAVTFAQDALWYMRTVDAANLWNHRFESLTVWATAVRADRVSGLFPRGYLQLTIELLNASGWKAGGVCVAHWVYAYEGEAARTHLFVVGDANDPKADRALLVPADLLTAEEKAELP